MSPLMRAWRGVAMVALLAMALSGCDSVGKIFSDKSKTKLPGTRISVLNLEHNLQADPKLNALVISVPRPYDNNAWPDSGGYPDHAMYHLALGDRLERAWTANVGDGASRYGRVVAQPVVADGRVFAMDADDVVTAIDEKTGKRLWRFDPQPKDTSDTAYGGGVAVAGDRIYVGTGYGQVLALEAATGKEIWRVNVAAPIHSPPTVAKDRVFVVTVENELDVLEAADGSKDCGLITASPSRPSSPAALRRRLPAMSWSCPTARASFSPCASRMAACCGTDSLAAAQPVGALSSLADIRGAPVIDRDRVLRDQP